MWCNPKKASTLTPPPAPTGPVDYSPVLYLGLAYCVIVIFIAVQLGRFLHFRHKVKSFQFIFLNLLLVWDALRAIFFLAIVPIQKVTWIFGLLYWVPVNIQFATFSLLVVYYAQIKHESKSDWRTFKWRYLGIWGVVNFILLGIAFVWYALGLKDDVPKWISWVHASFSGVMFFILICILLYYGTSVGLMIMRSSYEGQGSHAQTRMLARLSFSKILTVTFLLWLCFASRCLYDFLTAADCIDLPINGDSTGMPGVWILIAFATWEVIPSVLVLVLFGNLSVRKREAPASQAVNDSDRLLSDQDEGYHSASKARQDDYPPSTYTRPNTAPGPRDALLKTSIFADPNRYDTGDADVSPFQPSSGGFSPVFFGSGNVAASPFGDPMRRVA